MATSVHQHLHKQEVLTPNLVYSRRPSPQTAASVLIFSPTISSLVPPTGKKQLIICARVRARAREEAIRPDLQLKSSPSVRVQIGMADGARAPGRKVSSHT